MNQEQVKDIAIRFIADQTAQHEAKFGPSRFCYHLHEVRPPTDSPPGQWAVVFLITTRDGSPVDGPAVVFVDDRSGEARFLD